jgi:hypothetical protein
MRFLGCVEAGIQPFSRRAFIQPPIGGAIREEYGADGSLGDIAHRTPSFEAGSQLRGAVAAELQDA